MALAHSPIIIRNGLITYLDAANFKSYPGSGTIWSDLTGNGNNGTLTNGPTYSTTNNGSIVFDGVNDHSIFPVNFFSWPSLTTITISLWFRSNQTTGGTLFGQQSSTNPSSAPNGYVPVIYLRSDGFIRVEPFWTNSTTNNILSTSALNDNRWHNVTTTYNSGTNQLFIDGVFNSQRTGLSFFNYTTTYYYILGAGVAEARSLGTNYFSGSISNFKMYNRALTEAEIQQNFNALRGRFGI